MSKIRRIRAGVLAARWRPSLASVSLPLISRGRREGRVRAAPMARQQTKKLAAVTTGLAEHPAFPARWCYGLYVISPGPGLYCPRRARASSAHALDLSVGRPGPHDFAVRTDDARLAS